MCFGSNWSYYDETGFALKDLLNKINQHSEMELDDLGRQIKRIVWIIMISSTLNKLKVSKRFNEN